MILIFIMNALKPAKMHVRKTTEYDSGNIFIVESELWHNEIDEVHSR